MALTASLALAKFELTEVNPPDGARLAAPPGPVHLCFSQPLDIRDRGPTRFRYVPPDGLPLAFRVVYLPGHQCLDMIPGLPENPPDGVYTIEWHAVSADGSEEASGELRYQVLHAGATTPIANETRAPTPQVPSGSGGNERDNDGPGIVLLALLALAAAGGAAVLATLAYLVRRAIRRDRQRPPEG